VSLLFFKSVKAILRLVSLRTASIEECTPNCETDLGFLVIAVA
jgi:hypothetical protein